MIADHETPSVKISSKILWLQKENSSENNFYSFIMTKHAMKYLLLV